VRRLLRKKGKLTLKTQRLILLNTEDEVELDGTGNGLREKSAPEGIRLRKGSIMRELTKYSLHSYPSIYALGHSAIGELLLDEVLVEEKIDGSQFSFSKVNGEIKCRSKGAEIYPDHPEGMFERAVGTVKELLPGLREGWTYRAEYLAKPKHNTLEYSRTPNRHLILFDINSGHEEYLSREEKEREAANLGLEIVPIFFKGKVESAEQLLAYMDRESVLGGCKIEGFVIKNYARFGKDKKALMGKFVSESFKETNKANWKGNRGSQLEVTELLVHEYKTPTRWAKAVQHLREAGKLEGSPRDIGLLIKEVGADILKESEQEIKDRLFESFKGKFLRGVVGGLPEWYKRELLASQFVSQESGGDDGVSSGNG
jgi:hypothetical protein